MFDYNGINCLSSPWKLLANASPELFILGILGVNLE